MSPIRLSDGIANLGRALIGAVTSGAPPTGRSAPSMRAMVSMLTFVALPEVLQSERLAMPRSVRCS